VQARPRDGEREPIASDGLVERPAGWFPPLTARMSAKFSFHLRSEDPRRDLPRKIIIGHQTTDPTAPVVLKLLAFVLLYRERIQIGARLDPDAIPFLPDLIQLDYELRPTLWVECGECSVGKLDRLAIKVPEAEIWVVRRSVEEASQLVAAMAKGKLRRKRYRLIGLDAGMFEEMHGLLRERNELFWVRAEFENPSEMRFDFNGLWFDAPFAVLEY
jgi:hypothetical protein